jgi:putative thioredoxin
MLSPTLEKLADQQSERFSLIKINTDERPDLSAQYQVRGIPAVKLFSMGSVIAEFTGAMPEYAVVKWLDEHLPTEAGGALLDARSFIQAGEFDAAIEVLESLIQEDSVGGEASLLLARLLVFTDPKRALDLLSNAEPNGGEEQLVAQAIRELAEVLAADGVDALPESDAKPHFEEAVIALRKLRFSDAVRELIVVLQKDRFYREDGARRLGVALFTLLGPHHPVTLQQRRTFDMYLY